MLTKRNDLLAQKVIQGLESRNMKGFYAKDREEALKMALDLIPDAPEVFVIGGGQIYRAFLPLADRLYLTEAAAADPTADTWFPAFDPNDYTRTVLDENREGIPYRHVLYERKKGADANA